MGDKKSEIMNDELIKEIKQAAYDGAYDGANKGSQGSKVAGAAKFLSRKVLTILLVVACAMLIIPQINPFNYLRNQFGILKDVEGYDLTLSNNGIFGYTAADFADVILGDSKQLKKIEVYEQEVSDVATVTKAGFAKIKLFSKTKMYTYYGTVTYTVDLSKLNNDSISIDKDNNTVILKIPHVGEPEINLHEEETKFGDTEKGILAFGDVNLKDEEKKTLSKEIMKKMKEKVKEDKINKIADEFAQKTVWDLYQPLITKAAPGATLVIEFVEG